MASAVLGLAAVGLGFAAASRCRVLQPATTALRVRRAIWAVALGVGFGAVNLGANWLIANHHPTLRLLLERRFSAIAPMTAMVAAPLTEEVNVRLFLMSAIAWIVWRVTDRRDAAFTVALIASSVIFAAMHLARPFPGQQDLVTFYRASLLVKYTIAGLPMGWLFWRCGLPYAMLCHVLVNATHIALERFVF
jgi:membrane protease YdiL (CAAX protease family)